jgi:hypothetical protein
MIGNQNIQMQKAREYAISRGGSCLSDDSAYHNAQSRLEWKCSHPDHPSWTGVFHVLVNQKRWCPTCKYAEDAKRAVKNNDFEAGLKEAQEYAFYKGGQCLSTEYKNNKTDMLWKCHNPKHQPWLAKFNTLKHQNTWCKECCKENQLWNMNKPEKLLEAKDYAKNKNGVCLSKKYVNEKSKLKWKCHNSEHNAWFADARHVMRDDQWCPECAGAKNKTEKRVRMFLETHFGFSLESSRPDWNLNPKTGRSLELDGYNPENQIAFEHDGEHHFQTTLYSPSISDDMLKEQLKRDRIKKKNCKNQGVKLISIPILNRKERYKFFPLLRHVISSCEQQGVTLNYSLSQIKAMQHQF